LKNNRIFYSIVFSNSCDCDLLYYITSSVGFQVNKNEVLSYPLTLTNTKSSPHFVITAEIILLWNGKAAITAGAEWTRIIMFFKKWIATDDTSLL